MAIRYFAIGFIAGLMAMGLPVQADAEDGPEAYFTFQNDNDAWGLSDTDRYYTNGLVLDWQFDKEPAGNSVWKKLADLFSMDSPCDSYSEGTCEGRLRYGFSAGHLIFTPEDIENTAPPETDRPYAGYLYGSLSYYSDRVVNGQARYDTLEIQLGIIGEVSLGELVQVNWHGLWGFQRPNGWDSQVRDEPALLVRYRREWPAWQDWTVKPLDAHLTLRPYMEGALGNVAIRAKAGLETRFGFNMGDDSVRGLWQPNTDVSWSVFLNANGSAAGHNIFLAGNTFRHTRLVAQRIWVAEVRYGVTFLTGRFSLTHAEVWQSKEFKTQLRAHRYGSIKLGYIF